MNFYAYYVEVTIYLNTKNSEQVTTFHLCKIHTYRDKEKAIADLFVT